MIDRLDGVAASIECRDGERTVRTRGMLQD